MKAKIFNKIKASKKEIEMYDFFKFKNNANEIKDITIDFINTLYPNARIYKQKTNAVICTPYLLVFLQKGSLELNVYSLNDMVLIRSINKSSYETKCYIYSL